MANAVYPLYKGFLLTASPIVSQAGAQTLQPALFDAGQTFFAPELSSGGEAVYGGGMPMPAPRRRRVSPQRRSLSAAPFVNTSTIFAPKVVADEFDYVGVDNDLLLAAAF